MKNVVNENIVEFHKIEEFYFPKNCMICGDETENSIEKSEYGSFTGTKDYKKDYKFKLPICDGCNSKINLKAGKSGIILLLSVLLGISLGIIIYFITYSIILSVSIFTVLFIFPYLNYRAKIRPRIKLSDFMQMKVIPNEEVVQFTFVNKEYAKYVNKINQEKLKEKEKEKEKSENMEKKIPITPDKKEEIKSPIEIGQDVDLSTRLAKFPIKEIIEPKDANDINTTYPVAKKCPKCGNNLKPDWKFCVFCSEPVND